ncbi:MAG TPA: hypothetical protein DCE42_24025 [Myxococcales bacterium]|nr:hypothetical protein [Deltaproteobacteria bacterium]MBU51003.1 hypothetical protein [Deltaproteobacteria bacterium]HAA57855.1 hypothetical protein [Myxococcales bacterium]|tara:strand:+ start:1593 stop:1787 length:195 start_codon:yes stop_codon:yes gene_type:complete
MSSGLQEKRTFLKSTRRENIPPTLPDKVERALDRNMALCYKKIARNSDIVFQHNSIDFKQGRLD